jgi:hypothetical protein
VKELSTQTGRLIKLDVFYSGAQRSAQHQFLLIFLPVTFRRNCVRKSDAMDEFPQIMKSLSFDISRTNQPRGLKLNENYLPMMAKQCRELKKFRIQEHFPSFVCDLT